MSGTRKRATIKPSPVEALIRAETLDERITMIAVQVDQTMRVVEALGVLVLNVLVASRESALANETGDVADERLMAASEAAMERLASALRHEL